MSEKDDFINQWIEKADHDLGTAIITFKHLPEYGDTIAFHCQQAVEKYLKAWLVLFDCEVPRTHDLAHLLELLSQYIQIQQEFFNKALLLSTFSVEIRYPETTVLLSESDILEALDIAKSFRKLVLQQLGLEGKVNEPPVEL